MAHLLTLALTATLLALAFPHPGWAMLAHVALVPAVVLALRSSGARRLAWSAWLVGWVWWLVMIRWMWPVTGGGTVALAAYLALYWPAALLAIRVLDRGLALPMTLAVPMAWVSLEWVRGYALAGGFGWFALSHSQAPWTDGVPASPLIQIADLGGEWAVSLVVAMTSGLMVDLLHRPWVQPRPGRRAGLNVTLAACAGLWFSMQIGVATYGQYRIAQALPAIPSWRLSVVQTNVPQDNRQRPTEEQTARDWQEVLDLTRRAAGDKPDLILWPESTVPTAVNGEAVEFFRTTSGAARGEDIYDRQISGLARELGTHLLVGAPTFTWSPEFRMANSAFHYQPDGVRSSRRYDKMHRVPFGEFVPWVEDLPAVKKLFIRYLTPYEFDYTIKPGREATVFELPRRGGESAAGAGAGVLSVAAPICFEDTVARVTRGMVYDDRGDKRVDVLVNLTNDGWFAGSSQPWQHFQIAVLRCVELRVPMARSVNTGVSGFIDSVGRIGPVVRVEGRSHDVAGVASAEMRIDTRLTLFGRVGQWPVVVLVVATIILVLGAMVHLVRRR